MSNSLEGVLERAFGADRFPELGKALPGLLDADRERPALRGDEVLDVGVHGPDHVPAERLGLVLPPEDPLGVRPDDGVPARPPAVEAPRRRPLGAGQMDVEGAVSVGLVEPSEEPAQAIVHLDVIGRIGETRLSDLGGPELVARRVVRDVGARPVEGRRAAPAGAEHEDVHRVRRPPESSCARSGG